MAPLNPVEQIRALGERRTNGMLGWRTHLHVIHPGWRNRLHVGAARGGGGQRVPRFVRRLGRVDPLRRRNR
jgi:hypothetical protein